ncbi:MAG: restriction endonuclease subunit S [Candidatus Desulfobacillus denitrificans]
MNKNNENKLVPKYRFPEFANHGNWQEKSFSQLFEFGNGKDYKHLLNGDIPVYGTGGKMLSVNDYLFDGESVCIGRKGTIDSPLFLTGKFWTVDTLFYTHSFVNSKPKFIYYIFQNVNWYDYNEAGGVPSLSKTTIKQIKTLIPPRINEQEKIVACLSSLDEVIKTESQKLEVLKEHKKGLLQNLLPQAGETVPKFRFKEFEDSGEWVEKRVEDYFDVGSSKRVLQQDWASQGVPFYRTRELVSLSKHEPFGSEIFISEELYNDLKVNYGIPTIGDFLVSGVGTLGICYQVKQNDRFYFKDGNVIWFKLKGDLNSTYFKYCFESEHIQNQIVGQTSKSTVGTYTIQNAKKTKFWFAPATKEQEKIADTLSSIDELIIAQGQKLEAMQQHKKGLFQGLFPNLNEGNDG